MMWLVWNEMVEMGWTGLNIAEAYGGLGFGYVGLGQILEETGRTLTAAPLISNVCFGAALINLAGSDAQKEILLSEISIGNLITTVAFEESAKPSSNRSIHNCCSQWRWIYHQWR